MNSSLRRITDRILAASADHSALRLRAGGSKDFYGESLQGELLDLSPLTGIISYEPSELVVTAHAGTPLTELEAVLAESGQCLAFEPPRFMRPGETVSSATCGGMVAAGLAGPARASVGSVRDYVLGVKLINGRGELLTFGGQVIKNVAGYDVSRLMVGAMGALGVLTEISLKVLPLAAAEATLMCGGLAQQTALDLLNRWGGQPLPLNASCWLFDATASPQQDELFVRVRGARAAVQAACPRLIADVQTAGGNAAQMDNTQAGPDWDACRDQALPFFTAPAPDAGLWRLSVPQTTPALALPYAQFIEWHGGLRWLWAPLQAQAQLRQAATAVGGSATLFRAPELNTTATSARFHPLSATLTGIHQRLKAEFDPAGIFNRCRMYPDAKSARS